MSATIGTISHGTLVHKDLVLAFANELHSLAIAIDKPFDPSMFETLLAHAKIVMDAFHNPDDADLDELIDALNEFAPPYCYFGAHEGDGSDFGFWPSHDAIEELDGFNDLAEVPEDQTDDFVIVNDHGNMSIYRCVVTHELIWECV